MLPGEGCTCRELPYGGHIRHRDAFVEKPESAATSILPKMQTKARNQSTS